MGGSGVIRGWKVQREADRLWQQIMAGLGVFWEPIVQRRYDRNRASILKVTAGDKPLQAKVAVYLIFQPQGIPASLLQTCRMIEAAGYAPLVVSNATLTVDALASLRQVAWRIIQRPNYGYDFGGYREGILHLQDQGITPDRLLVMNDSIWFPLGPEDTLLPRLEASGLDVAGSIVHRSFKKTLLRRRATRVIESYLFLFSRRAVESDTFQRFWRGYWMSSNKFSAVRRGERRVAEAMMAGGLTADGLFSREGFLAAIEGQPNAFLRKTLEYAAYTDDDLQAEGLQILADHCSPETWRDAALDHFRKTTQKRNFHGSFAFATLRLLDVPLLKKSGGGITNRNFSTLYKHMRERYVAAVLAQDLAPPRPEIIAELALRDGLPLPDTWPLQDKRLS
jgi:Rhamnan synthesis protein F